MSRWIKKTPLLPLQEIPVRVVRAGHGDGHSCAPPGEVDAGPRSIWECDCGERWRIAVPYWRSLGGAEGAAVAEVPAWVRALGSPPQSQQAGRFDAG